MPLRFLHDCIQSGNPCAVLGVEDRGEQKLTWELTHLGPSNPQHRLLEGEGTDVVRSGETVNLTKQPFLYFPKRGVCVCVHVFLTGLSTL